jgi:hypothetical protein
MSETLEPTPPGSHSLYMDELIDQPPIIYYTDPITQKTYPADVVQMVDHLLVKIRHKPIWEIVEFCLMIWAKRYPTEYKEYLSAMKDYREARANEYASTKNKWTAEIVKMPPMLHYLLTIIAGHKIQDYGEKKFYQKFAKKYPGFSPASKI